MVGTPEWDAASDVMRDAQEHLSETGGLPFFRSLGRSIEFNLERSGIRRIDEGVHYEPLLLTSKWYVAAMLVRCSSTEPHLRPVAVGLSSPMAELLADLPVLTMLVFRGPRLRASEESTLHWG